MRIIDMVGTRNSERTTMLTFSFTTNPSRSVSCAWCLGTHELVIYTVNISTKMSTHKIFSINLHKYKLKVHIHYIHVQ